MQPQGGIDDEQSYEDVCHERDALRDELQRAPDRRWETGFRNIVTFLVGPRTPYDIPEIVEMVRRLAKCDGNGDPIGDERAFVPGSLLFRANEEIERLTALAYLPGAHGTGTLWQDTARANQTRIEQLEKLVAHNEAEAELEEVEKILVAAGAPADDAAKQGPSMATAKACWCLDEIKRLTALAYSAGNYSTPSELWQNKYLDLAAKFNRLTVDFAEVKKERDEQSAAADAYEDERDALAVKVKALETKPLDGGQLKAVTKLLAARLSDHLNTAEADAEARRLLDEALKPKPTYHLLYGNHCSKLFDTRREAVGFIATSDVSCVELAARTGADNLHKPMGISESDWAVDLIRYFNAAPE